MSRTAGHHRGSSKPNVVLIFVDDMGHADIGPSGKTQDLAAAHPDIVARLLVEATTREAEINVHKRPAGQLSAGK